MKIRHPFLVKSAGFSIAWMLRLLAGTIRFRHIYLGPPVAPLEPGLKERFLYSIWHEALLLPPAVYRNTPMRALISEHADGEMIAQACLHLGLKVVRGSTTRGGIRALFKVLRSGAEYHLAVTPDGPRGPRRSVQPGLVYLASRTGLPIVPAGYGFCRAWRAHSWDRFAVPLPFSTVFSVVGEPLHIPADLDRDDLAPWVQRVQQVMDEVTAMAEGLTRREPENCLALHSRATSQPLR